jgi:multidrug efflux pump subunit AcrA (membrane-fusion protein)/putative methionine-R-sulfoxide reductase with GAF domain
MSGTTPPSPVDRAPDLRAVLRTITARMSAFMGVERSSIFLHDPEKNELWTPVAQGLDDGEEIRIRVGQGIAGTVMQTGETLRIDDPYQDPRFNPEFDRKSGFRTRNLFCRPITSQSGRRIGVIQLLNKSGGPLASRDEDLLEVLCAQAAIAIENAQLSATLQRTNSDLRIALGEIEHASMQRELIDRRMKRLRLAAVAVGFAAFGILGLLAWKTTGTAAHQPTAPAHARRSVADPTSWHTVATRDLATGITLQGNIEPLEIVHLTSPFRGRIAEKHFSYGELVTADQPLARIDTTDLEVELRIARTALFRARHELDRLENWNTSPEVARAERALLKARLAFEANERNLRELEQLSALGIIAASTLESARQQFATQEADYRSAEEDLANVRASASTERVTIARYEVENATLRVGELERKLGRAQLVAPFSGIVILPNSRPIPNRNRDNNGFFEIGTTIAEGEVLLSLGNLQAVAVRTRADEVDIAGIRHGQPVEITGDAFPGLTLHGTVDYLSSQAILTNNRPYFEVGVRTRDLTPAEQDTVRLGMSARLRVLTQRADAAVVVPIAAVFTDQGRTCVWKRPPEGSAEATPVLHPVTCGMSTLEHVQVLDGLSPGDAVLRDARLWRAN